MTTTSTRRAGFAAKDSRPDEEAISQTILSRETDRQPTPERERQTCETTPAGDREQCAHHSERLRRWHTRPGVTEEEMEQKYDDFDNLPPLPTNDNNELAFFDMTDDNILASPTPSLQPPPPPAAAAASTPSQRPTGTPALRKRRALDMEFEQIGEVAARETAAANNLQTSLLAMMAPQTEDGKRRDQQFQLMMQQNNYMMMLMRVMTRMMDTPPPPAEQPAAAAAPTTNTLSTHSSMPPLTR
jgi:hypothetical protein